MKPTIGQIVWYFSDVEEPLAAIVTAAHTDICVNLTVFNRDGSTSGKLSIMRGFSSGKWDWIPHPK